MRGSILVCAAVLFVATEVKAQEAAGACQAGVAAVITEIQGACSVRSSHDAPARGLSQRRDRFKQLRADEQLKCDGGHAVILFCGGRGEKTIERPTWYTVPNTGRNRPLRSPFVMPGRTAEVIRPINPVARSSAEQLLAAIERAGDGGARRVDAGIEILEEVLKIKRGGDVRNFMALDNRLAELLRYKPFEGAASPAEVRRLLEQEDPFELRLAAGNAARSNLKFDEAERSYVRAVQLNPKDARAAYGLGNVYADQGRWQEAEAAYRRALELAPQDTRAHLALGAVLLARGGGDEGAEPLAEAEAEVRRSVELDASDADAYELLGAIIEERGRPAQEAEQAYRRAVELNPQLTSAYIRLGDLLQKDDRAEEARTYLRRAADLARDSQTLTVVASVMQDGPRYSDSEPLLRRVLALNPRDARAHYLLGRVLIFRKSYRQAEAHLASAVRLDPSAFPPRYLLGRVYLGLKRLSDAEAAFRQASQIADAGSGNLLAASQGLSSVGDSYAKANRPRDAMRAYQLATELAPDDEDSQEKLAVLRRALGSPSKAAAASR
jgi:tetratricopeptide (TPR) repeat protein